MEVYSPVIYTSKHSKVLKIKPYNYRSMTTMLNNERNRDMKCEVYLTHLKYNLWTYVQCEPLKCSNLAFS